MPRKISRRSKGAGRAVAGGTEGRTPAVETAPTSLMRQENAGEFPRVKLMVLVVLVALLLFGLWKKEWFVAAMVNGQPITRLELDQTLVKQSGAQTLEDMIRQKVAEQMVAKEGITVSDKEVDDRIAQITSTLPKGMTLDQVLQSQGVEKAEFRKQIKLQLAFNKVLTSKVTVTDKEVDEYIASNAAQFRAVPPETAKSTARRTIEQQKGFEWFSSLRQKADVKKFI